MKSFGASTTGEKNRRIATQRIPSLQLHSSSLPTQSLPYSSLFLFLTFPSPSNGDHWYRNICFVCLQGTETHFLLELLQNVDDCKFGMETPTLRLIIEDDQSKYHTLTTLPVSCKALLALEYNETGFEEHNVRALCDIAQSTKEARHYIGAKGIGFKSVFRVTPTPTIHSGKFHFHFDSAALEGLGYLVPFPLTEPSDLQAGTRLVLPIYEATTLAEVRSHIQDIEPTLLLFLRNLRSIEIMDTSAGLCKRMSKDVSQKTVALQTMTRKREDVQDDVKLENWNLHTFGVTGSGEGAEIFHTDLILAFCFDSNPTTVNHLARPSLQQAFAWLPLRSYGLRFILQADWVVPSSRESIVESNAFNQAIRDAVPASFAAAIKAILITVIGDDLFTGSTDCWREKTLEIDEGSKRRVAELYNVIPLPGEALDFFARTPVAILEECAKSKGTFMNMSNVLPVLFPRFVLSLQELQDVPFILARAASSLKTCDSDVYSEDDPPRAETVLATARFQKITTA